MCLRLQSVIFFAMVFCVVFLFKGGGGQLTASQSVPENEKSKKMTINFPLLKGQYVFIGLDSGKAGKVADDLGIAPITKDYIDKDGKYHGLSLQLTVQLGLNEDGEKVWKWCAKYWKIDEQGKKQSPGSTLWDLKVPDDKMVEDVKFEKIDVSKETGVEGLKFYKIPFTKIKGEVHYVIVVIGDKKELFAKAISIPKNRILFRWSKWPTFK